MRGLEQLAASAHGVIMHWAIYEIVKSVLQRQRWERKATHASHRWDVEMQVTAGRMQRDDGVMKYMLVMQLFQKAIDSEVPHEYRVPVLSGW